MYSNIQFNTEARQEIRKIANITLTKKEIAQVESIVRDLISLGAERTDAIQALQKLIGTKPKRPLYYLNHEIEYLPEETRDVVRYAGDYIDQLMKTALTKKDGLVFLHTTRH